MTRRRLYLWRQFDWSLNRFAVLLSLLFLFGTLAGCLLCFRFGARDSCADLVFSTAAPSVPRLLSLTWSHLRWLTVAVLLGLSALGLFGIPLLLLLRGVVFGFSFAALFPVVPSLPLLAGYLGVAVFAVVPLLLLGCVGMSRALAESRSGGNPQSALLPLVLLAFSVLCSVICACIELWLAPMLVL